MNFAISVSDLAPSQLSFFVIDNINKYTNTHPYDDIVIFSEDVSAPCIQPRFGVVQIYESWGYEFPVIATNITTALKTINCPSPRKKFLYIWDLEWFRKQYSYDYLTKVYRNDELSLIAKSSEHAKIISGVWGKDVVGIVENFDIDEIAKIVSKWT
jgi:hypothetical protein